MVSSLSNLVNNLSKGELNVNSDTMIKNGKHVEANISVLTAFYNTQILKIT